MTAVRALAFLVLAPVLTAVFFALCCVGLLFDPVRGSVGHAISRVWARSILLAAGARLVVTGAEHFAPGEARVVVANHASYLDIPAMLAAFPGPLRIVARRSLAWLPFIGWYIFLQGHFFLDRDDPRQALALMERAAARMRRRRISPLVYPEGTRSRDGRLQVLKAGAFFLPLRAQVPVQPVAILGSREILPKGAWAPRRGGTIEVRVGDAIPTAGRGGAPSRKALAAEVRASLLALGVPAGDATPAA